MLKKKKINQQIRSQKRLKKQEIFQKILNLFYTFSKEVFNYEQVNSLIKVNLQTDKFVVAHILENLYKKKILIKIDKTKYQLNNNTKNTILQIIQNEYNLPCTYPKEAEIDAQKITNYIDPIELSNREDFRQTLTFTIDPNDAKDFDDALSIKKLSNNLYEIGVHIADVTHYIKPNSSIDKEALKRGTSIYLVDKTIPMLPELLCNKICSIRPNEDKLCFSIIFEIDNEAKIHNYRVQRTVIRSYRRFTYEEVQEIIEKFSDFNYKADMLNYAMLDNAILILNYLAKILRKKRFANGSINFEQKEIQFHLNEYGKPLNIYFKKIKESNQLVEEFMLLANKTVAEIIGKSYKNQKAKTFIYRVHDVPNKEKMKNFVQFIQHFGYKLNNKMAKNFNLLFKQLKDSKEKKIIETIALQTMGKAIYTTKNIGHYGLAFKYYTHFTSPIRRYPDMVVHRLLEQYLDGKYLGHKQSLEKLCKHCSEQETIAIQAERAYIKAKQVEFMSNKIGNIFNGLISGVTEWGLYVELNENGCEGLIPMRYLNDDFYELDKKSYRLIGKKKKHIFSLGDPLQIKVMRSNLEKRQLDFAPIYVKK